jgi:hypothetical protein
MFCPPMPFYTEALKKEMHSNLEISIITPLDEKYEKHREGIGLAVCVQEN